MRTVAVGSGRSPADVDTWQSTSFRWGGPRSSNGTIAAMGRPERRETSGADVHRVLDSLRGADVDTWVSGGWGVDALVGHQTRPHRDLDLLVPLRRTLQAHTALSRMGFQLETDWFP